ncbi:MAG: hypothetical protein Q9170_002495 [Blastenia crenularia]
MPQRGVCPAQPKLIPMYDSGNILLNTQVANLLHEAVHYYLDTSLNDADREVYHVAECFNLNAKASTLNPNNYVLYVLKINATLSAGLPADQNNSIGGTDVVPLDPIVAAALQTESPIIRLH